MNNIRDIKNKAVLLGWIMGLLVIIALLWILTQPLQVHYLLRTVNSVFIASGDSRRVISHIPASGGKTGLLGYWYAMYNSTDQMFIFTVFQDGILVPLGAIVSVDGKVDNVIPLSAHAEQIMDKLPQSIIQMYVTRIEASVPVKMEGRGR